MTELVIDAGSRGHALCWKFEQEGYPAMCAPGSAGMAHTLPGLDMNDFDAILRAARSCGGLTVFGTEVPICGGAADWLTESGRPVLAPSRIAALTTEGSKAIYKRLLRKYDIPTMPFQVYDYDKLPFAFTAGGFIEKHGGVQNIVVKASGLAGGKGVILPKTEQGVYDFVNQLHASNPSAVREIVIEERAVDGENPVKEASLIGLHDGDATGFFDPAQDFKLEFEADHVGPNRNTGGMGGSTIALDPATLADCQSTTHRVNAALKAEGILYRGFFYDGFLLTKDGPKVAERNCRFGSPEAETILPSLGTGFYDACRATAEGRLGSVPMPQKICEAVTVVLAERKYPDAPDPSDIDAPLKGLDEARDHGAIIFHGSTRRGATGFTIGKGGRVLAVVGTGETRDKARKVAYGAAGEILKRTPTLRCRSDIAR